VATHDGSVVLEGVARFPVMRFQRPVQALLEGIPEYTGCVAQEIELTGFFQVMLCRKARITFDLAHLP
jgi:hypothetical protein